MDEPFRQRLHERAIEMIRSGEYDHLVIPDRGAGLGRNNQDDRSLSYSIRDIPTFDSNGDSLSQMHMLEFSDFLDNTGSEIRYLPQEPQADDREYHMAVIKDVVSKCKVSLKGKPRLWFEMQYPTSADEPKTKEAYGKMVSSFITEHNLIGSTKQQQMMAWKTLNWNPAQERLDDFVYKLRIIGQELGITEDEQLEYFKCSVPPHLYLYHKDATTIKEAMENIKRACALGGVSVQAVPVEPRATQLVPFMQMAERTDSKIVARKDDHIEVTVLTFNGMLDSLEKFMDRLSKSVARTAEIEIEMVKIDIEGPVVTVETVETVGTVEIVGTIETVGTVGTVEEVTGVTQTQAQQMIDKGLEVEIVLEVDLEVGEELSRTVFITTNQTMICLIVIDIPKTYRKFVQET